MKRPYDFVVPMVAAFLVTASLIPMTCYAQTVEIVRPGDRAMTCQALAAEINTLGQPEQVAQTAKPKKHGGMGLLRALGAAAPMMGGIGGLGGLGGGMLSSVAGAASSTGASDMQGQVEDKMAESRQMARDAMNGGSPAQQRKARLTAIFDEKHC